MAIEKMSLVNLVGSLSELDDTLIRCCESGSFHVENSIHSTQGAKGFEVLNEPNPYSNTLSKLVDLSIELSIPLGYTDFSGFSRTCSQIGEDAGELDRSLKDLGDRRQAVRQEIAQMELASVHVEHLRDLDVSFDRIFSSKYVRFRFGRLPRDGYEKLSYYEKSPFFFFSFDNDRDYYWGIYFVPTDKAPMIDEIFASLLFERIRIPHFAHGTPQESLDYIAGQLKRRHEELAGLDKEFEDLQNRYREQLPRMYAKLKFHSDVFDLRKHAAVLGDKFYLVGFVPSKELENFSVRFEDTQSVVCVDKPPDADSTVTPPIKLRNRRFAKPFENFVEMYGLPSYHGFDPTSLVAVTYCLLFGIMFGDVGQGLMLILIGWLMHKFKKMYLGAILERCGVFSALFGCVYGSVFGYEEALNPLYKALFGLNEKPVDVFDTNTTSMLLIGAVGLGVVLIILSMCINIFQGFKTKDHERALFSSNGLAGLIFYLAVIAAAVGMLVLNINVLNPVFIILFLAVPLLVMFLKEPLGKLLQKRKDLKPEGGVGMFIVENFFEMFETLLSYVTNTMSFLRVGGFVLSHAGMMAVVMTLAHMVGSVGNPIVVIIGNAFVMAMEGLIVGIQVLRLEYYEIFSRFYDGDGKPFEPVKITYDINNK